MLDLSPDTGVEAARLRYRELAREHHPDTASANDKDAATRVMTELNWAMEELERDAKRWQARIGSPVDLSSEAGAERKPVSVSPTLVLLNQENGFVAYVTAAAPDIDGEALQLRYASAVITVERLASFGGVANFRITLAEGACELPIALRERIEVRAHGCDPVQVSVAVEAFSKADVSNEGAEVSAPRGHFWIQVAGWATAAAGTAAVLLYAA